jgi:hypothetical protein
MASKSPYKIKAESVESCNCRHGCNCQFEGIPNEGKCEFIIGYEVKEGRVGDVKLDGMRFVVTAKYPKAIHEGNGHVVLFIDDKASEIQVGALVSVLSGQLGGMPWEALAGTIGKLEGPVRKPIEMRIAAEKSVVRIPGSVELELMPIKDVMSGQDKRVQISYPDGGFFWNVGRIASTKSMRAQHGDYRVEWPGKFACAAEVNWTNH